MQIKSLAWYNSSMENNHGENMKNWTRSEIDRIICNNDKAVEKAMVRLFDLGAFHDRDVEAGTHFAQWLSGMNSRNEVKYPQKSLTHSRAKRRFRKLCLRGEEPIDRARRIALLHSQILADYANRPIDNFDQIPLPFLSEQSNGIDEEIDQIIDGYDSTMSEVDEDFDQIDLGVDGPPPGILSPEARAFMSWMESDIVDWDEFKSQANKEDGE